MKKIKKRLIVILITISLIISAISVSYIILNRDITIYESSSGFDWYIPSDFDVVTEYKFNIIEDQKGAVEIAKAIDKAVYNHNGLSHLGSITYHDKERNEWQIQLKGFFTGSVYIVLSGKSGAVIAISHGKF